MFITAGRSTKEIAKNTVSYWLRKTISRAYQLSGRSVPVPPPRAGKTMGYHSVFSVKELRCRPGVEGGYMAQAHHLHASLLERPCTYVPRNLPPGSCGSGSGLGLTLAARPDIPSLPGLMTDHPPMPHSDVPVQRLVFTTYVSMSPTGVLGLH